MACEIVQIVEDDCHHAALLDRALREAHYRTNVASDGSTGLADIRHRGKQLVLCEKEWLLLRVLASRSGHVFSTEELIGRVWGR